MNASRLLALALGALSLCGACDRRPTDKPAEAQHGASPTNRIDVPEAVRKNLGIEFVKVERRRLATTLRLAGRFELLPQARREYRAPLGGRVQLLVEPMRAVVAGDALFTLDSLEWRRRQHELAELESEIALAAELALAVRPLLDAHKVHETSLREALRVLEDQVQNLQATAANVGGQVQAIAEARVRVAATRAQIAEAEEQHTETQVRLAELQVKQRLGRERRSLLLAGIAATIGVPAERLAADDAKTNWRSLDLLTIRATYPGIVDHLPIASGGLAEAQALVLATTVPHQVRFRARALQSDLHRLADGMPVRIVPPGGQHGAHWTLASTLQLGTVADAEQRTLDVYATPVDAPAARAGLAAFLEIETSATAAAELCVPSASVLPDGLLRVLFRRDPNDRDKVIRVEADLGLADGRWVEVKSGLVDGDEVVAAGAYELMLASSGTAPKGGHFHADGTFHADDHK